MQRTRSIPATRSDTLTGTEASQHQGFPRTRRRARLTHSTRRSTRHGDSRPHVDPWGWRLPTAALIIVMLLAVLAEDARAATTLPKRGTVAYCKAQAVGNAERACIIRVLWAPLGQSRKALRVAWCESRFDPRATNGQFRGVWQMGSRERARFGHDGTVEGQTRAAIRYYRLSGWSPWECA